VWDEKDDRNSFNAIVLLLLAPAYARSPITKEQCFDPNGLKGDYYISFVLSAFSGKVIEDGSVVSSESLSDFFPGMAFNLCGTFGHPQPPILFSGRYMIRN